MSVRQTVHIVDDDAEFRDTVRQMLMLAGVPSQEYASAEQFLDSYQDINDDARCLVLDIVMPGMGGMALLERLAANGIDLPVIFVTAQAEVSTVVAAMKQGAVDFLEKPLQLPLLKQRILEVLATDGRRDSADDRHAQLSHRLASLSARETEVKDLLLAGHNAKQIASQLGICPKTAMKHRARVLDKLGVESTVQLVRLIPTSPTKEVRRPA
jgi:FixJ family two-component response regulator